MIKSTSSNATSVTVNKEMLTMAKEYTLAKTASATLVLVIAVTNVLLGNSNYIPRELRYNVYNKLLGLLPYEQRNSTTTCTIHGERRIALLHQLKEKLQKHDPAIHTCSDALNHALGQFIIAYKRKESEEKGEDKEVKLTPPIHLLGSKRDAKMQIAIRTVLMGKKSYSKIVDTCTGALSIFRALEVTGSVLLNDLDKNKIALYRTLQHNACRLLTDFVTTPCDRELYEIYKKRLLSSDYGSEYEQASLFLYLNFYDLYYGKMNFHANNFSLDKICLFLLIAKKLQGVRFDTKNLLSLIPTLTNETDTLLLCDPPYIDTDTYQHNLTNEEHHRLAKMLLRHKGDFVYFCRVSAKGDNAEIDTKLITAKIEDAYANHGLFYLDVPTKDGIERIITNFPFEDGQSFVIPPQGGNKSPFPDGKDGE